ncbi:MAG: hypothetical protein JSW61_05235 [Candidatus Thorarchaeota archaeon]|nr:MAG: hypothetical protein JSW61_05235 [Candidatus Thorarchaeota archaeon]
MVDIWIPLVAILVTVVLIYLMIPRKRIRGYHDLREKSSYELERRVEIDREIDRAERRYGFRRG